MIGWCVFCVVVFVLNNCLFFVVLLFDIVVLKVWCDEWIVVSLLIKLCILLERVL